MSGIPVYTAENPTGITPQTALPPFQTSPSQPASTPADPTTAAAPTQSTPFAPAQPGAAVPAPTHTSSYQHSPSQAQPSLTTAVPTSTMGGPPQPQPGAVPTVPQPTSSHKTTVPPPPKAGEAVKPSEYYAPVPTAKSQPGSGTQLPKLMPYQWQQEVSNPTRAQPPASTTSAYEMGRKSLEHPPGYVQNPNVGADSVVSEPLRPLDGLVGGGRVAMMGDEGGVWDTAKKWATDAAGKVREMEEDVWRRINGEGK